MNETFVIVLGSLAALLQLVGYVVYTYDVFRSGVKPNPASWLIWSYGNALVCLSYVFVNQGNIALSILPILCSIACVVMAVVFLSRSKFRPVETFEKYIIASDLVITVVWVLAEFFGFAIVALPIIHILLLVSAIISYIPIYKEIWHDRTIERSRGWVVWTIAYFVLALTAISSEGTLDSLMFPILYAFLCLGVVMILKRKV